MQKRFLRTLKAAVAFSLVFSMSMPAFAASEKKKRSRHLKTFRMKSSTSVPSCSVTGKQGRYGVIYTAAGR